MSKNVLLAIILRCVFMTLYNVKGNPFNNRWKCCNASWKLLYVFPCHIKWLLFKLTFLWVEYFGVIWYNTLLVFTFESFLLFPTLISIDFFFKCMKHTHIPFFGMTIEHNTCIWLWPPQIEIKWPQRNKVIVIQE